jgi:hypothetical protein
MTKRDNAHSGADTLQFIPSTGSPSLATHTWTVGSSYWLRWVKAGTAHQVRVWDDGTAEPGTWDITATDAAITPLALFAYQQQPFTRVFSTDPNATMGIWWGPMDFAYAGQPCYADCAAGFTDSFARTVGAGWGTSDIGVAWALLTGNTGTANYSVSPGAAVVYADAAHHHPGDGDPGLGLTATVPDGLTTFTFLAVLDTGATSAEPQFLFSNPGESSFFGLDLLYSSGAGGAITVSGSSGTSPSGLPSSISGNPFLPNAEYSVAILRTGSEVRAKVWPTGGTDPGWMVADGDPTIPRAVGEVYFFVPQTNCHVTFGPLTIGGLTTCPPVEPTAVTATAPYGPNGFGCVTATRSSSTAYTVPNAFVANSTMVWRDGLLQRRGTDYTEDAGLASVTFSSSVASTSAIRICYFSAPA